MFISLRESGASGFKRWSDLQHRKYGDDRVANVNNRILFETLDFAVSDVTPPVPPHRAGRSGDSDRRG